jgi:hypothetical protein
MPVIEAIKAAGITTIRSHCCPNWPKSRETAAEIKARTILSEAWRGVGWPFRNAAWTDVLSKLPPYLVERN